MQFDLWVFFVFVCNYFCVQLVLRQKDRDGFALVLVMRGLSVLVCEVVHGGVSGY